MLLFVLSKLCNVESYLMVDLFQHKIRGEVAKVKTKKKLDIFIQCIRLPTDDHPPPSLLSPIYQETIFCLINNVHKHICITNSTFILLVLFYSRQASWRNKIPRSFFCSLKILFHNV